MIYAPVLDQHNRKMFSIRNGHCKVCFPRAHTFEEIILFYLQSGNLEFSVQGGSGEGGSLPMSNYMGCAAFFLSLKILKQGVIFEERLSRKRLSLKPKNAKPSSTLYKVPPASP